MVQSGPQRSSAVYSGPQWSTAVHSGPQRFTAVHSGPQWSTNNELLITQPHSMTVPMQMKNLNGRNGLIWSERSTVVQSGPEWSRVVHSGPQIMNFS